MVWGLLLQFRPIIHPLGVQKDARDVKSKDSTVATDPCFHLPLVRQPSGRADLPSPRSTFEPAFPTGSPSIPPDMTEPQTADLRAEAGEGAPDPPLAAQDDSLAAEGRAAQKRPGSPLQPAGNSEPDGAGKRPRTEENESPFARAENV